MNRIVIIGHLYSEGICITRVSPIIASGSKWEGSNPIGAVLVLQTGSCRMFLN